MHDIAYDKDEITCSYIIPNDENGRQNIKIIAIDESGNENTAYANYIVNTLGVIISDPIESQELKRGVYTIRGIASDPNITNSYRFKEYSINYIMDTEGTDDDIHSDNICVPESYEGSSPNISIESVLSDNILGYIDLDAIYDYGADKIRIIVTAIEDVTDEILADTCAISINNIVTTEPNIFIYSINHYDNFVDYSYRIINKSSHIKMIIKNNLNERVNEFILDDYYCFEKNLIMNDDTKVYIYKNDNNEYFIESGAEVSNVILDIEEANIDRKEGEIEFIDGKYIISGAGVIEFTPNDLRNEYVVIKSEQYPNIIVGNGLSAESSTMRFGGIINGTFECVDMLNRVLNPGEYTATLEVTGFDYGYISDNRNFTKSSNLEIIQAQAFPGTINPYEPGFETSIININANETCTMDLYIFTPSYEEIEIENSLELDRDDIYQYVFDGMHDNAFQFGEWTTEISITSIDNEVQVETTFPIFVEQDQVSIYHDGLYIPNEYISGELDNKPVINAKDLYTTNYYPEGLSFFPLPYNLKIYSHGRRYLVNPGIQYMEYVDEYNLNLSEYSEMLIDSSISDELGLNFDDEDLIGKLMIYKHHGTKIRLTVNLEAKKNIDLPYLPEAIEWECNLDYVISGESKNLGHWDDDNHDGLKSYTFEIIDETGIVEIQGNVDIHMNTIAVLKIKVEYFDIDQRSFDIHNEQIQSIEDFFLNDNTLDFDFKFTPYSITLPHHRIASLISIEGQNVVDYDYDDIPQPIYLNYLHKFILTSENTGDFDFPIWNSGIDCNLPSEILLEDKFVLNFNSQNICNLTNLDSDYNILSLIDFYYDTLNVINENNNLSYQNDEILLNDELLKLKRRDDVYNDSVYIDDIEHSENIDVELEETKIHITPQNSEGQYWSFDFDGKDQIIPEIYSFTDSLLDFPDYGNGDKHLFSDNYSNTDDYYRFNIIIQEPRTYSEKMNRIGDKISFLPHQEYFSGKIHYNTEFSTEFTSGCDLTQENYIELIGFDNSEDISDVVFEVGTLENNEIEIYSCAADLINEPEITATVWSSENHLNETFMLNNGNIAFWAINESLLLNKVNNLHIDINLFENTEQVATFEEDLSYNDLDIGLVVCNYTYDTYTYSVTYYIANNRLNILYQSSSGHRLEGSLLWTIETQDEYIIDDPFILPDNYDRVEVNCSTEYEYEIFDYYKKIFQNPVYYDNNGVTEEITKSIKYNQNGSYPIVYAI